MQATCACSAQELNVLIETLILTHTRLASVSSSCKAFIMLGKALPKRLQQHQGGSLKFSRTCKIAFNPASGQSHQTTPDKKRSHRTNHLARCNGSAGKCMLWKHSASRASSRPLTMQRTRLVQLKNQNWYGQIYASVRKGTFQLSSNLKSFLRSYMSSHTLASTAA